MTDILWGVIIGLSIGLGWFLVRWLVLELHEFVTLALPWLALLVILKLDAWWYRLRRRA